MKSAQETMEQMRSSAVNPETDNLMTAMDWMALNPEMVIISLMTGAIQLTVNFSKCNLKCKDTNNAARWKHHNVLLQCCKMKAP